MPNGTQQSGPWEDYQPQQAQPQAGPWQDYQPSTPPAGQPPSPSLGQQPPQQQVAAGGGAITPQQLPAGGGAIGPGSVLSGAGQWLKGLAPPPSPTQQQPTAGWPSEGPAPLDWLTQTLKKAMDLPEELAPEAEQHLKNFLSVMTGIAQRVTPQSVISPPGLSQALQPSPTGDGKMTWGQLGQALMHPAGVSEALGTPKGAAEAKQEEWTERAKDAAAAVAGIKRQSAQAPTQPAVIPKPSAGKEPISPDAKPAEGETTMRIWDAFSGDTGLSRLADHVIAMEGDSKVARQNNNPGNLKDPKTGGFRKFGSYEEGRQALLGQLKSWREKFPDWTIQDFNRRYAPDKSHGGDNPEGTEESRNQYLLKALGGS